MSLFYMYFLHLSLVYSSFFSFPRFFSIMKLNGTNYKNEKMSYLIIIG